MTDSASPVVVIGAGAAGLLAALFAARGGARVILLERMRDGGRKILIAGGGRCNILPAEVDPRRFVTGSSRHTLRNILLSWPLEEQRAFFERELRMKLVLEEETGKYFPETHRARDVRDRLLARVREAGVDVRGETLVTGLQPPDEEGATWRVMREAGPPLPASSVILATGGLSVPSTGSDGTGLAIARGLGIPIHDTSPALTPLLADPPVHGHLAGLSLTVTIRAPCAQPPLTVTGGFLFTHRGYSGPAVLDTSHLAIKSPRTGPGRQELLVQWTPRDATEWDEVLRTGPQQVGTVLSREMPARLATQLLQEAAIPPDTPLAQLSRDRRRALVTLLTRYPLPWTGDEGFRKAEVTAGGVDLAEINPRTMESRRHPGLFLCGEILDAFGPIGGHNFSWAWVTGRAAGKGAGRNGKAEARETK